MKTKRARGWRRRREECIAALQEGHLDGFREEESLLDLHLLQRRAAHPRSATWSNASAENAWVVLTTKMGMGRNKTMVGYGGRTQGCILGRRPYVAEEGGRRRCGGGGAHVVSTTTDVLTSTTRSSCGDAPAAAAAATGTCIRYNNAT